MTTLLATKFNQIATAIDTTNAQIAALQAKLSELLQAPATTTISRTDLSVRTRASWDSACDAQSC